MGVTFSAFFLHDNLHLFPVVPMERVAFDIGGIHLFTPKDLFECLPDRGGSGPGRTGHRNNWMLFGHGSYALRTGAIDRVARTAARAQPRTADRYDNVQSDPPR